MSGSKPSLFRGISLTLGRKKKRSVDERYADLHRDSVADQNGEQEILLSSAGNLQLNEAGYHLAI